MHCCLIQFSYTRCLSKILLINWCSSEHQLESHKVIDDNIENGVRFGIMAEPNIPHRKMIRRAGNVMMCQIYISGNWHSTTYMWRTACHDPVISMCWTFQYTEVGQDGRHFADGIFQFIFLSGNYSVQIALEFVLRGLINNRASLVQIMAWGWKWPSSGSASQNYLVNIPDSYSVDSTH